MCCDYAITGEFDVNGALKESAIGVLNPAKTLANAGKLAVVLSGTSKAVGKLDGVGVKAATRWKVGPNDIDFRGSGKSVNDALDVAFKKTGLPKDEFNVTKWGATRMESHSG
jgi:hypothetical protein